MGGDALRDPAGLLERAPEIAALAESDGPIRKALAKGDPRAVYRALWWARLLGRLKPHRQTLDALLAHRRLFATPFSRSPALGTMNGIGAMLYGASERDLDGSYVKSHFLVFAFVPVFPFAQYLVKDAEGGGDRSWYIIAKVPTSVGLRLWRGAVVAVVMATLGITAFRTFHASRHHDVHVVNSLPVPVGVQIGAVRADVPAGQRQVLTLPVGTHAVTTSGPSGETLESGSLAVEAGPHVLVWNVLGAGSVYVQHVTFGTPPNAQDDEPLFQCGRRAVRLDGIDYAFTDPPRSISLPKGQTYARRKRLGVMTTNTAACASVLARGTDPKAAQALATDLARFDDEGTTGTLIVLWRQLGRLDEAVALARRAVARRPDSVDMHRIYQTIAREQGLERELREEYGQRARSAPDSPDAAYLYARMLPFDEAHAMSASTLKRFPEHVHSVRLRLYGCVRRFELEEAVSHLAHMRTLAPDEWLLHAEEHAEVLAALGRPDEAKILLEAAFATADEYRRVRLAGVRCWLGGAADPSSDALYRKVAAGSSADALRFRIRFWMAPGDAALKPLPSAEHGFQRLALHAHFDPSAALRDVAAVPLDDLASLDNEVLLLLLGEAARAAEPRIREKLEAAVRRSDLPLAPILAYLERAGWSEDVERLQLPVQGALHLSRSRRSEIAPPERDRLRALARRCDPAGGFVTRALADWPSS